VPTLLLLLLALSLPFGMMGPSFMLGALGMDVTAVLGLAALAGSLAPALKRNLRPDLPGWASIAWAGAWLVSSLAAPANWGNSSLAAWNLAIGPLIFAAARPVLPPRSRNIILAGLGTALAVAALLHASGNTGLPAPAGLRGVPWNAVAARPLTGSGPGSFPDLPLWAGLLPRGGLLAGLAGAFLLGALGRAIYRHSRPARGRREAAQPALLLAALIISGLAFDPLAPAGTGLGFWMAMSVLLPPARPAYNAGRRA
jgi:hypothetical protein